MRSCLAQPLQAVQPPLPGAEDLAGSLGVVVQRIAGGEDLHGDRLVAGLAGLPENHLDELVLPLDERVEGAIHVPRALVEAELCPVGLRLARGLERGLHVLGRRGFELASGLERGWIPAGDSGDVNREAPRRVR